MFPVALTGSALFNHHQDSWAIPASERVTLAGYFRPDGIKPSFTRYYEQLMKSRIQNNAENTSARICVGRIVEAIKNRRNYKNHNDEVLYNNLHNYAHVLYHGNRIAVINYTDREVYVYSQWWRTKSTKDRLNRILMHFCGCNLFQHNYVWTVRSAADELPFTEGMCLPMI